jgi:ferredoxin-NADP reductase
MNPKITRIKSVKLITHDVLQIVAEKPADCIFEPGQASEVSINKPGWEEERRPFIFTSLPESDELEFTIKTYPSHKGVTNELLHLKKEDELILTDVFGAITYRGKGLFIAGGAGITPFISIFRYLKSKNEVDGHKLIFANKTKEDIILNDEFESLLGNNFINILSDEKTEKYAHGMISEGFLKTHIDSSCKNVYVCGPPPMMEAVEKQLLSIGIDKKVIVVEEI